MAVHPTFTHAVADLRRQAFLAEAASAARIAPREAGRRRRRVMRAVRHLGEQATAIVSRVVDDFEPMPLATPVRDAPTRVRPARGSAGEAW